MGIAFPSSVGSQMYSVRPVTLATAIAVLAQDGPLWQLASRFCIRIGVHRANTRSLLFLGKHPGEVLPHPGYKVTAEFCFAALG